MKTQLWPCLLAAAALFGSDSSTTAQSAITIEQTTTNLTVCYQGRKMMVYRFAPGQFKPYVGELFTINGQPVLRDSPSDHVHHHGLMFAIKANGVNFWEETPGCGFERPVKITQVQSSATNPGTSQAGFTQLIHWVAAADKDTADTAACALLEEERTLTLVVDESKQEVSVRWESSFKVGAKAQEVVLTGANYHGLGLRFPQDLDPVASHLNANGPVDNSGSRQDISQARWSAVLFNADAKPRTVAVFGDPDNARGNPFYFTMLKPFSYLSATQQLDQKELRYQRGDSFKLKFLVAAYPDIRSGEFLNQRSAAWKH